MSAGAPASNPGGASSLPPAWGGVALPDTVRLAVERALSRRFGEGCSLTRVSAVGGGCIAAAARVQTARGTLAFLKWSAGDAPAGIFAAEAKSLAALRAASPIRAPAVYAVEDRSVDAGPVAGPESAPTQPAWLLLEWLEPGAQNDQTWRLLGRGLAGLHREQARRYGWPEDNFIGTLPQSNGWVETWPAFWREKRLAPQIEAAATAGHFDAVDRRRLDRLLERLDDMLSGTEADGASLLHGDLWGGNIHVQADGTPALIDPSCAYGHREVDLAMSELFGGFGAGFLPAYHEVWPLLPGYRELRRHVYQLYYLLVHVNLFGRSYCGATLSTLSPLGC